MKNNITSIAIGGFDGMHLAHQELFKQLDNNGAIIVIHTGYANLSPLKYRQEYSKYPKNKLLEIIYLKVYLKVC